LASSSVGAWPQLFLPVIAAMKADYDSHVVSFVIQDIIKTAIEQTRKRRARQAQCGSAGLPR
jgi:hypothetical protein